MLLTFFSFFVIDFNTSSTGTVLVLVKMLLRVSRIVGELSGIIIVSGEWWLLLLFKKSHQLFFSHHTLCVMLDDAGDDTRRVREKGGYGVVCSHCAGRTVVKYRRQHAMPRLVVDVLSMAGEPAGCWFHHFKVTPSACHCCLAEFEQKTEDEEELSYIQKHARLTEEFGTAKGKRLVEARMRNKVKSQDLETIVNSAVKDFALVNSSVAGESNSEGPAFIPPHNRDATQPEDVYVLDDIITPAEMVALMGPATVFVNATFDNITEWRESGTYPGYVMHQLSILPIQVEM